MSKLHQKFDNIYKKGTQIDIKVDKAYKESSQKFERMEKELKELRAKLELVNATKEQALTEIKTLKKEPQKKQK